MKRTISILLCLMLVLSLAVPAFAAEGDPTITVPNDGHIYEVYQIFTAKLTEKGGSVILSDVMWGANGTGTTGTAVDQSVLDELKLVATIADNEAKLDVITKYVDLTGTPVATLDDERSAKVAPGYYLIKDQEGSVTGNESYTTYIVEIVDDVTITRKADVPEVDKVIVDDGEKTENEASVGDTINYKFTGTMPTNIADYNEYFYKFTDTMSAGLDYAGNLVVTVEGIDVTKYFYVEDTKNGDGTTTLIVGIQDLLALENATEFAGKDITAATNVVVTYDAILNENAVVGNNGNMNKVDLRYDNNPNDDGEGTTNPPEIPSEEPDTTKPTGTTPADKVWTYTTEIEIEKVDQDGNILTGAAFTITGEGVNMVVTTGEVYVAYAADDVVKADNCYWLLTDGTYTETDPATDGIDKSVYADLVTKYHKEAKVTIDGKPAGVNVEAFVDATGVVKFSGLGAGTYIISESVVPEGYNSIADITVVIGWDASTPDEDNCTWTYDWSNGNTGNSVTIVNQSGSTLPETGGVGTTLFYVFGSIMFIGAAVLLITKKRMAA